MRPRDESSSRGSRLIAPYGGALVDLRPAGDEQRREWRSMAVGLPSLTLTARSACDLELLSSGAFSPLDRFMGEADYRGVLSDMRLRSGVLFPIPVTLPIPDEASIPVGSAITLRSDRNEILAVMSVEECFARRGDEEARQVFGTGDPRHPLIAEMGSWGRRCISGPLVVLALPASRPFKSLRLTPAETRARLAGMGRSDVVAFQTRNPIHRAHEEMTKRASAAIEATLLLHPAVGRTKPGDVDVFARVRSYQALVARRYDPSRTLLSVLPLAMRMAGPREAVWHAIVRRNHGANHFIVGRDHAGPGRDASGRPFYDPDAAQRLAAACSEEIGVGIVPFEEMVYLPDEDHYEEAGRAGARRTRSLSGTEAREVYLAAGRPLPEWYSRPEVARILAGVTVPRHRQGFCVWFTGLSGAGKSTIAEALVELLLEEGRRASLLDGDVVRTHLSRGLGFSKEDRDVNVRRIGFVASEIVRHDGAVVCAAISPYDAVREEVRAMVGADRFFLVWVATPLPVCEARDAKGLYARARRGEVQGVTGVNDPYEAPRDAALVLDTEESDPEASARRILDHLRASGLLEAASAGTLAPVAALSR